jgi:hypothetical protein
MAASAPQKQLCLYPTEVQVPNDASLSVAEVKKLEMADFGSWCNLCVDVFAFSL